MVEASFVPSSFPRSIWILGEQAISCPLLPAEVERRLREGIDEVGFEGLSFGKGFRIMWPGNHVHLWQKKGWAQRPAGGASFWDFTIGASDSGTTLQGDYRLSYVFLLYYALFIAFLVYLLVGTAATRSLVFLALIGIIVVVQLVILRMTASRGRAAVVGLVTYLLDDSTGSPDPRAD